jgi:non-specific serine/threonine protein kinase
VLDELAAIEAGLLVLDNCEQVLDDVADLVPALLASASGLRVVLTSREPLGIDDERQLRLQPLSLPMLHGGDSSSQILDSAAARLFVDRLVARDPSFVLDDGAASDVAALCQWLEGMPLAMELAAARAAVVGLFEARRSIESGDPAAATRGRPERQRSLSAVLEWSYDLLNEAQRRLWESLSVFVTPYRMDDAVAICGESNAAAGPTPAEVAANVLALVEKSVIARVAAPDGERFRMHQTVREFGRGRLEASGAARGLRDRHATWALRFVELDYLHTAPEGFATTWLPRGTTWSTPASTTAPPSLVPASRCRTCPRTGTPMAPRGSTSCWAGRIRRRWFAPICSARRCCWVRSPPRRRSHWSIAPNDTH